MKIREPVSAAERYCKIGTGIGASLDDGSAYLVRTRQILKNSRIVIEICFAASGTLVSCRSSCAADRQWRNIREHDEAAGQQASAFKPDDNWHQHRLSRWKRTSSIPCIVRAPLHRPMLAQYPIIHSTSVSTASDSRLSNDRGVQRDSSATNAFDEVDGALRV